MSTFPSNLPGFAVICLDPGLTTIHPALHKRHGTKPRGEALRCYAVAVTAFAAASAV
jgi:hypothetical protein